MPEYRKNVPLFFEFLLGKLSKYSLSSVPGEPYENIHYQPSKEGIRFYLSDVIKLSHEMSHVLELSDDSRLLKDDYGIPKYFPLTDDGKLQALARESRTRGIQSRMVEIAFGGSHLLRFNRLPLDIGEGLGKMRGEREVLDWSGTILATAYRTWDRDRIVSTWSKKAIIMNDFLETR